MLLIFISSIMDYTIFNFVERLVFENNRPHTIRELKAKLAQVFADINLNHKDLLWKAHKNFKVRLKKTDLKLHKNNHFTFCYSLDLKNALKSKELGSKENHLDHPQSFMARRCQIMQPKIKVSTAKTHQT